MRKSWLNHVKLTSAMQVAQTYIADFQLLKDVVVFSSGTHFVAKLTKDVVCKVKDFQESNVVKSLKDGLITQLLLQKDVPVVSFCEGFPKDVELVNGFVITFRKYEEDINLPHIQNPVNFNLGDYCIKNAGEALAKCHLTLRNIQDYLPEIIPGKWNNLLPQIMKFPDIFQKLNKYVQADQQQIKKLCCSKCFPDIVNFQKLISESLMSITTSNTQLIHGDYNLCNVLQTFSGPLINDFESCRKGPIEYDIACFLKDPPGKIVLTDQQKSNFLEEYKNVGGSFNQEVVERFTQIRMLQEMLWQCPLLCVNKIC